MLLQPKLEDLLELTLKVWGMMYTMPRDSSGQTTLGAHAMERELALVVRRQTSSEQDASVRRELDDDGADRSEVLFLHLPQFAPVAAIVRVQVLQVECLLQRKAIDSKAWLLDFKPL